jgi:hypothetical protein
MKKIAIILLVWAGPFSWSAGQSIVPFTSGQWQISGDHTIETYKGRESLLLDRAVAYLPSAEFENGVIEFDIALSRERGFQGVRFRVRDEQDFEEFYLRPHQSGNPDAMQYTPVFNGVSGWQLYYGEGHGATFEFKFDEWMHVRLLVDGDRMEVYIEDMDNPVLHAFDLKRPPGKGYLGVYSGLGKVRFANFSYRAMESVPLKSPEKDIPEVEQGTIIHWQVSDAFDVKALEGALEVPETLIKAREWKALECEFTGTVNLARAAVRTEDNNTVFAKFTLEAEQGGLHPLDIGYSDAVKIYCNGRILYAGQRRYLSRDYRYLGTIGYFDTVYLPLQAGENEVWFAVTEAFGGWGVKAKLPGGEGLELK